MAQRATPALRELGGLQARACGALPAVVMDAAAVAAKGTVATRAATLEAAAIAALPAGCAAQVASAASSPTLLRACPLPPPLTDALADELVRHLAVGELAFVLAVAQALHAQGLLAGSDGERLALTLALSLALARSG